ncbi:hypothetical protein WDW86_05610 [Bdellovibrionota bacterium FG-2]
MPTKESIETKLKNGTSPLHSAVIQHVMGFVRNDLAEFGYFRGTAVAAASSVNNDVAFTIQAILEGADEAADFFSLIRALFQYYAITNFAASMEVYPKDHPDWLLALWTGELPGPALYLADLTPRPEASMKNTNVAGFEIRNGRTFSETRTLNLLYPSELPIEQALSGLQGYKQNRSRFILLGGPFGDN